MAATRRISPALLRGWALLLLIAAPLAACAPLGPGGATSATIGGGSTAPGGTTAGVNPFGQNVVQFTASGALTGAYSVSDGYSQSSDGAGVFNATVMDQNWQFDLSIAPFAGLGTYTVSASPGAATFGDVAFVNPYGAQSWRLTAPATCQVTVSGDTTRTLSYGAYHEVKGTFACPTLAAQVNGQAGGQINAPLAISDGRFDLYALAQAA